MRTSKNLSPLNQRNKFNATTYAGKERDSPELVDMNADLNKKVFSEVITVPKNLDRPFDPNQTKSFKIYPK